MSRFDELNTQFVMIEREQLGRLVHVAKRLYTEQRMNGDEMRDAAHTITGVLDQAIDYPAEIQPASDHGHTDSEAERLVRDIVNVVGFDVQARRVSIAQTYIESLRRRP